MPSDEDSKETDETNPRTSSSSPELVIEESVVPNASLKSWLDNCILPALVRIYLRETVRPARAPGGRTEDEPISPAQSISRNGSEEKTR